MQHAKTFVMASLPAEPLRETVAGQDSTAAGPTPQVLIDLRPPTPDLPPPLPPVAPGRETDALFEALLVPIRRRLLAAVCASGGACVSTLSRLLGRPRNLVSRHLGVLRMRGLVDGGERRARAAVTR